MSKFEETMNELNYQFEDQEGKKLTYRKRAQFSELALVIDLETKTINPILVPVSLLLYRSDFVTLYKEFEQMRNDAKLIAKRSGGKMKVLN